MNESRNSKQLASFVAYCEAHPELRFWQALRNWCGWHYVLVAEQRKIDGQTFDTWHWEESQLPPLMSEQRGDIAAQTSKKEPQP